MARGAGAARSGRKGARRSALLDELSRRIRTHVLAGVGLTNEVVYRLCKLTTMGERFKGVYAADRIPLGLAAAPNFTMIVNLGRSRGPDGGPPQVGHFVTVVGRPGAVYYVDPFGLPCAQPQVKRFLRLCERPVKFGMRRVQALDSVYCGFFAMLFAMYLNARPRPKFRLMFHATPAKLKSNDQMCLLYLRRLIK